jgi:hypothetical protein
VSGTNPELPVSLTLTRLNFNGRGVANDRLLMPLVITFLVRTGRDRL